MRGKIRNSYFALIIAALCLFAASSAAQAACIEPPGSTGEIVYNTSFHVPQYCNSNDWIALGPLNPTGGGAGCNNPARAEGQIVFNSSNAVLQYCDGSVWRAMLVSNASGGSTSPSPPTEPTSGLIAHWKLDENGATTTAADSAGTNDGTLTNFADPSTAWQPAGGIVDGALQFDGSDDFIDAGTGIDLANKSFTLAAWAKRSSSGTWDIIFGQGTGAANQGLQFGFRNTNSFTCSFWGNDLNTGATYTDTNWHLWTCTYDAATNARVIYRDGAQVASNTASADFQGSGNFLISDSPVASDAFNGLLDDGRVYNRALSATEVGNLYAATAGISGGTHGYFVLTKETFSANLVAESGEATGMDAANALCLADLTANDWKGKADAQARGLLDSAHVKAFICSNGSCNNSTGLTRYYFARAGAPDTGGSYFDTSLSGFGPNNRFSWSGRDYFGGAERYFTGRRTVDQTSEEAWNAFVIGSNYQCGGWSSTSRSGQSGTSGSVEYNDRNRWSGGEACDSRAHLVCFVNP